LTQNEGWPTSVAIMKTSLFDFDLPPERIATHPVSPRDASRMLVVKPEGITDSMVKSLPDFLRPGDVMVFNDTRVIPARLSGKRGEVNIEITLHKRLRGKIWRAFAKPGKRLRIGDIIQFAEDFSAKVLVKHDTGEIDLQWECENWRQCLNKYGKMPLPQYMKRNEEITDKQSYQTVYAAKDGAVAAPTAGLHFTQELLNALDAKGIKRVFVTLHVGAGTFLPVKVEDTENHNMHSEYIEITDECANTLNVSRETGKRIIAVGTTSLRVLESVADENGKFKAYTGETDIFITPGYTFKVVDILMTNFHLPKSTLFMLVSAFTGLEYMQKAYRYAIEADYRFYSYGDSCLLFKA
jgi:S-adenosylmethionine:tRNA ribosyltransferase-isomerase